MSVITNEISLLVSSDPAAGAQNVSANGSAFTVIMNPPIQIPKEAMNVRVSLVSAEIWNNTNNVSAALGNNKFYITIAGTPYTLTFEDGLYTVAELSNILNILLKNINIGYNGFFSLLPNFSTGRILLSFNTATLITVDFTQPNNMAILLGADTIIYSNLSTITTTFLPNVAQFNIIDYYLFHTTLISSGMALNGIYNQILSVVPINAAPGSLISFSPFNPAEVKEQQLAGGNGISNIRIFLTDQNNNPVSTNGETYGARILIKYEMPYILRSSS